jgi:DNA-binding IclR family transcriptional regulator
VNITQRIGAGSLEPGRLDGGGTRYRNQATQRVLAVLAAFVGSDGSLGVTELSRALGMNKNMVHRALSMLTSEGYLARDASGQRYQLGYRALDLAGTDVDEFDIRALCRPVLEELHRLTGESAFLSIIVGQSRVNVDWIEARGRRVSHSQRGRSVPLHCTEMSRVLLACLSDREITEYLRSAGPLDRYAAIFPDTSDMTVASARDDIARVRWRPHVIWRNPRTFGGAAYITFPLLDGAERPHAIITVGGPIERFGPDRIERLVPEMTAIIAPLQQQCRLFSAAAVFLLGSMP